MAISRTQKEAQVALLSKELGGAGHVVLLDFKGLDVPQTTELRRQVRAATAQYRVVKNRLAVRAVEGTPHAVLRPHFRGTIAVAYSSADPVALAKTLVAFTKTTPVLKVKAAVVEGEEVQPDAVTALAELPPKQEMQAKLLAVLNAPATQLVQVLGAVPRNLMNALAQEEKKRRSNDG